MRLLALLTLLISASVYSQVGKISKVVGTNDAVLERGSDRLPVNPDADLQLNDIIHSENAHIVIHLFPGTQMSLAKKTQIKISEHMIAETSDLEKTSSVIDFIKGIVRVQVVKDADQEIEQKIQADGVAFAVRGTEFEVSQNDSSEVDLDVIEGEVEVSSPYVHTFVPEIVKANQGFRFDKKKRSFARRKFFQKFKDHPGFQEKKKLREIWKAKKESRKSLKRSERLEKKAGKARVRMEKRNQQRARKKGSGN